MTDVFAEMEKDALDTSDVDVASDQDLKTLAGLVSQQIEMEEAVNQLEAALRERKQALDFHKTKTIPNHMNALGTSLWRSADGFVVELKPFVSASIPKDKRDEAYSWLREHGHGDLIKNEVTVGFGMKEMDRAEKLLSELAAAGYSPSAESSVHSSSLKKWLRDQVEVGTPVPLELFGAYLGQVATIKKG